MSYDQAHPTAIRRSGIAAGATYSFLDFVIMSHSDNYITLLVSFFDIPVSLGNLFQRIAPVYNWF